MYKINKYNFSMCQSNNKNKNMQLKMSKPLNKKLIKQYLAEEDAFISKIFSGMPLPTQEIGNFN